MLRARARINRITDLIMTQDRVSCSPPSALPFLLILSGSGFGISQSNHPRSRRQNIFFNRARECGLWRDDSMWPEGLILSPSPCLNEKVYYLYYLSSPWFFSLSRPFFILKSAKFSSFANFAEFGVTSSSIFLMARQVPGTCGALRAAWACSIPVAAGCGMAARPHVKAASIARLLRWSETAGLTPRRQRV